jgi:hypothetical protein
MVANSLSFPMVHKMAPNGQQFACYSCRKVDRLLNQNFWADWTFLHESGLWRNFVLTSPETLYMKDVVNEFSFLLVTHMTCFDIWFDCYGFLKSGFSAGQILNRLGYRFLVRFLGHKMAEACWGPNTRSEDHLLTFSIPTHTHVSDAHSHGYGHFDTARC